MFYWLDSFINVFCPSSIRARVRTPTLALFLTFYADLIKWADGRTVWLGVPGLELWSTGVWPAVWPFIGVHQINMK
jgi:hypothetical protein